MRPVSSSIQFDTSLVPEPVRRIRRALKDHELYVVGGIVRDSILAALKTGSDTVRSVVGNDWDLATSARPDLVMECLREEGISVVPVGVEHGTVMAVLEGESYEITTFRQDRECDGRHATVGFAESLAEDLRRRDFTVNAFALSVETGRIIDEFHGLEDLGARLVRAIGDPEVRFREDYLRMLRAVRLASQIEGTVEEDTWQALCLLRKRITKVSAERVRDEMMKLLATRCPSVGLDLMRSSGLLKSLFPELNACVGVRQNQWHADDVWRHSLLCVDAVHPRYPQLRLIALLHDVAKPDKKYFNEGKQDYVFYDHQFKSADVAERIMKRLRFPTKEITQAKVLIREHMFNVTPEMTPKAVRRLMRRVGTRNLRPFLRLRIADRRGNRLNKPGLEPHFRRLVGMIREIERSEECLEVRDLAIGGEDLKQLGLTPGPVFTEILNHLLEQVLDDPVRNNRETLLALVDEWLQEHPGVLTENRDDFLPSGARGEA
jgi:tRNA nucleotidyltransferase (CCA-adding enzyme)